MTDMEKGEERGAVRNRRRRAGETLTETLITILIVGLSSALFLTMVGASGRIFRKAETEYEKIYGKITEADVQSTPFSESESDSIGKIVVKGSSEISVKVNWYGNKDYVLSYLVR